MIDLDSIAQQYREASHYWQKQWDAVVRQFKERESELLNELMLTRQQWEAEHEVRVAQLEKLEKELAASNKLIQQYRSASEMELPK